MIKKICISLLILLALRPDITTAYEAKLTDEITFKPVLDFQGTYDAEISDEKSNFTYPFSVDGGSEIHFNDDNGKLKNKFRITSSFTRDVDDLDNKFLGKISDVYLERNLNDNHKILIGNSRIPIGMEGGQSQYNLLFIKRSQIASNLGNARSTGIRLRGDFGTLDYDIGGYSSTRYLQNLSDGIEFAGWINYKPFNNKEGSLFKNLKIGTGLNTGKNGQNYTVTGFGAEYKYKKFLLNAEYAYANGSNAKSYNQNTQHGFYATAAYNLTDKIQILGRYDIFDANTKQSNDTSQKYTVGINYYALGQRIRFSLNYSLTQNDIADSNIQNSIYFMTQLKL